MHNHNHGEKKVENISVPKTKILESLDEKPILEKKEIREDFIDLNSFSKAIEKRLIDI